MTKSNAKNHQEATDASFNVDTSVTRKEIIEQHFQDIESPDKELDDLLVAMGLKAGGNKFKAQTAYFIGVCRGWINSGEITDYAALTKHWEVTKAEITANFTKIKTSLATTEAGGELSTGDEPESLTPTNPAMSLSTQAQVAFAAGKEIVEYTEERITHNQKLTAQVIDASFFEGVRSGVEGLGNGAKKLSLPPLLTDQQAAAIVQKVVRDSQQHNNSK